MSLPLYVLPSPQMSTPSSCIACTSNVPVTARPNGVVLKYVLPAVAMWKAPHCSAIRPSRTSSGRQSTSRACSAPYCLARSGTPLEVGLVVLAEVGRVGVRDRPLGAHPGDRGRRVEPAGEGDADALADGQRQQDAARRPANVLRSCERSLPATLTASYSAGHRCGVAGERSATVTAVAAGEAGDGDQRAGGGDGQLDHRQPRAPWRSRRRRRRRASAAAPSPAHGSQPRVVDGQQHHHERGHERQHRHERGCGSPNGPSHHVLRPSSALVFHTAA